LFKSEEGKLMKFNPLRFFIYAVLCVTLLFVVSCNDSSSDSDNSIIAIDVPSESETMLAENRDFYVIGYFEDTLENPGNISKNLFFKNIDYHYLISGSIGRNYVPA
jgi:hypothetical protein